MTVQHPATPLQSLSAQSVFPSQSLSRVSLHVAKVSDAAFVESKTPAALSHKLSPHSLSCASLSVFIPVFVHVQLGHDWYLLFTH